MRLIILMLASGVIIQPAYACSLDGEFGMHRFNPFLAMQSAGLDNRYDVMDDNSADAGDYSPFEQENDSEDQEMPSADPVDMKQQ